MPLQLPSQCTVTTYVRGGVTFFIYIMYFRLCPEVYTVVLHARVYQHKYFDGTVVHPKQVQDFKEMLSP